MCNSIIPQWRVLSPGAEYNSAPPKILNFNFGTVIYLFILSFFMPGITSSQTDTLVCDNGGFESGFTYYTGSVAQFDFGSLSCLPINTGLGQSTWTPYVLPAYHRFEIVASGTDALAGISKTKFGGNSLLLNNKLEHVVFDPYETHRDINKIIKRFKVTEETKDFTVWLAVVFENPQTEHYDAQPFFHITCDLAPNYDLCFDASILKCEEDLEDTCELAPVDVLDWSCHNIRIPEEYIGEIATLEISVADCGKGEHFGYAYIDGICETCDSSSFGSGSLFDWPIDSTGLGINYKSCEGDTIIVCGSYTIPNVCGLWNLDSIDIPDFTIYNLEIDTSSRTFCFELPKSNFTTSDCRNLFAVFYFKYGTYSLPPVYSNTIDICPDDYKSFEISVVTGSCQNNGTSVNMSDDYYYVQVTLGNVDQDTFSFERILSDPYPNESGEYLILRDTGNGTFNLGPFFIQEGEWDLVGNIKYCTDTFHIVPPNYCSGCSTLRGAKVFDIGCDNSTNPNTWSFKLNVSNPGQGASYYTLDFTGSTHYNFDSDYTFSGLPRSTRCKSITLTHGINQQCITNFIICPPKPCNSQCNIEAYLLDVYCNGGGTEYYFNLRAGASSSNICCNAYGLNTHTNSCFLLPNGAFGPFDEDIELTLIPSATSTCNCNTPSCYKTIYIPFPDCNNLDFRSVKGSSQSVQKLELEVIPNPVHNDIIRIHSSLLKTEFQLLELSGEVLFSGKFESKNYDLKVSIPSGVYIIKYSDDLGKVKAIKFIKL